MLLIEFKHVKSNRINHQNQKDNAMASSGVSNIWVALWPSRQVLLALTFTQIWDMKNSRNYQAWRQSSSLEVAIWSVQQKMQRSTTLRRWPSDNYHGATIEQGRPTHPPTMWALTSTLQLTTMSPEQGHQATHLPKHHCSDPDWPHECEFLLHLGPQLDRQEPE